MYCGVVNEMGILIVCRLLVFYGDGLHARGNSPRKFESCRCSVGNFSVCISALRFPVLVCLNFQDDPA